MWKGTTQKPRALKYKSLTYDSTCLFTCLPQELWDLTDVPPKSLKNGKMAELHTRQTTNTRTPKFPTQHPYNKLQQSQQNPPTGDRASGIRGSTSDKHINDLAKYQFSRAYFAKRTPPDDRGQHQPRWCNDCTRTRLPPRCVWLPRHDIHDAIHSSYQNHIPLSKDRIISSSYIKITKVQPYVKRLGFHMGQNASSQHHIT